MPYSIWIQIRLLICLLELKTPRFNVVLTLLIIVNGSQFRPAIKLLCMIIIQSTQLCKARGKCGFSSPRIHFSKIFESSHVMRQALWLLTHLIPGQISIPATLQRGFDRLFSVPFHAELTNLKLVRYLETFRTGRFCYQSRKKETAHRNCTFTNIFSKQSCVCLGCNGK